jgi:DNA repair protein SbcC/Rad50
VRPLRLSFSGMRSYPGECGPLDFTERSLVGVLGDTGAGKSTLLEAITYALYGTCTWHGDAPRALIAEGAQAMSVDFTFVHAGERWRAHRVAHADATTGTHLLENLDTGEQVDNRRPVDQRIVKLLQLDYKSFQAAVLLPQGRFDRLLTATDSERPQLLKGIFGVDALTQVRAQAARDRDRLGELVHQAEVERNRLHDNPAAVAEEAARQAAEHGARAAALAEGREELRELRREALAARGLPEELSEAVQAVAGRRAPHAAAGLRALVPLEGELATLESTLGQERRAAEEELADCARRAEEAGALGQTAEALATAQALLDGLGRRLTTLAEERRALRTRAGELDRRQVELDAREQALPELRAKYEEAAKAAESSAAARERAREGWTLVNDAMRAALAQAVALSSQRERLATRRRELAELDEALPRLGEKEKQTREAADRAEAEAERLRSADAAHRAAHGLAPGHHCPVCSRPLGEDFEPPRPQNAAVVERASSAHRAAREAHREAERALNEATARREATARTVDEQERAVGDAEQAAHQTLAQRGLHVCLGGCGSRPRSCASHASRPSSGSSRSVSARRTAPAAGRRRWPHRYACGGPSWRDGLGR